MALPSKIRIELEKALSVENGRKRYYRNMRKKIDRIIIDMNRKKREAGIIKKGEVLYKTEIDESDRNYFYAFYTNEYIYGRT